MHYECDMSDLSSNLMLIFLVISYTIGIASYLLYMKVKLLFQSRFKEEKIILSIVSEYTHRLNHYDKAIAELGVKIETLELRLMQQESSHNSCQRDDTNANSYRQIITSHEKSQEERYNHMPSVSNLDTVTHKAATDTRSTGSSNGTMDFILKMLVERPRTTREIQHSVGRTREHTSRLMKKLYDSKLVLRDSNSKPFRYSITDAGRIQLMGHHGKGDGIVYDDETQVDSTGSQLPEMT